MVAYPELLLVGTPGRLEVDSVVSSGRRPLQFMTC